MEDVSTAPGHPFYEKLNQLLEAERFDEFVESRCAKFYAARHGSVADAGDLFPFFAQSDTLRASGRSAALPGGWRTRWHCGVLWASGWMSIRRITRRFRARGV